MLYTRYIILYAVIALAGALPMALYGVLGGAWWLVPLAFLWIMAWAIVFAIFDARRLTGVLTKGRADCRPDVGLETYRQLLTKKPKRARRHPNFFFLYSAALLDAGYDVEGLQVLNDPASYRKTALKPADVTTLENNRLTAYLHLNDLERAAVSLQEATHLLHHPAWQKPAMAQSKTILESLLLEKTYHLNTLRGYTQGAESFYTSQLSILTDPFPRLGLQYYLGLVYWQEQRWDEATGCFSQVAQNGGTAWMASKSRERLAALQGQTI